MPPIDNSAECGRWPFSHGIRQAVGQSRVGAGKALSEYGSERRREGRHRDPDSQ